MVASQQPGSAAHTRRAAEELLDRSAASASVRTSPGLHSPDEQSFLFPFLVSNKHARNNSTVRRAFRNLGGAFFKRENSAGHKNWFNPEDFTAQKREWAKQYAGPDKVVGWPSKCFEQFLVVGLPPTTDVRSVVADVQTVQSAKAAGTDVHVTPEASRDTRHRGTRGQPLPPQVLYSYPEGVPLAADAAAFCFPHGVQPSLLERTPSMSALNEVIYSQQYQSSDANSFVFLLKVADNLPLYGVCCYMDEIVHRPPCILRDKYPDCSAPLSRYLVSAPRCYCLLTHYPFFSLHLKVLHMIMGLERLDRITGFMSEVAALSPVERSLSTRLGAATDTTQQAEGAQKGESVAGATVLGERVGALAVLSPQMDTAYNRQAHQLYDEQWGTLGARSTALGGAEAAGSSPDCSPVARTVGVTDSFSSMAAPAERLSASAAGAASSQPSAAPGTLPVPMQTAIPAAGAPHASPLSDQPTTSGQHARTLSGSSTAEGSQYFTPTATPQRPTQNEPTSAFATPTQQTLRRAPATCEESERSEDDRASPSRNTLASPATSSMLRRASERLRRTMEAAPEMARTLAAERAAQAGASSPGLRRTSGSQRSMLSADLSDDGGGGGGHSRRSSQVGLALPPLSPAAGGAGALTPRPSLRAADAAMAAAAGGVHAGAALAGEASSQPARLPDVGGHTMLPRPPSPVAVPPLAGSPLPVSSSVPEQRAAVSGSTGAQPERQPSQRALALAALWPAQVLQPALPPERQALGAVQPAPAADSVQAAEQPVAGSSRVLQASSSSVRGLAARFEVAGPSAAPPAAGAHAASHVRNVSGESLTGFSDAGSSPGHAPAVAEQPASAARAAGQVAPASLPGRPPERSATSAQPLPSAGNGATVHWPADAAAEQAGPVAGAQAVQGKAAGGPEQAAAAGARRRVGGVRSMSFRRVQRSASEGDAQDMPPDPANAMQVMEAYYHTPVPSPGEEFEFAPDPSLQPVHYSRPRIADTGSEYVHRAAIAAAEAEAAEGLRAWTVATLCRSLSLDNIILLLTGALLERQMVVFCPNIGVLSTVVLALVPLLRPFAWQSLLLPVVPTHMLPFLEAPVPFILGIQYKTPEVRSRAGGLMRVNIYKDKIKTPGALPQLPGDRALLAALAPSYVALSSVGRDKARGRPAYAITDEQRANAETFLRVMHNYLTGLCGNLEKHTITDVQTKDRVSLLLKDSFVESFSQRDRPFIRQFVETQMFSVYCDSIIK